jgi:hypothetical protein
MSSIYHAFNMQYKHISDIAHHLADLGFTHVQFPPIQRTRVLSGTDLSLIQNQLKVCDVHLQDFEALCLKARAKNAAYPTHIFDYLLQQRVRYINQPMLQQVYKNILNGVCTFKNKLKDLYAQSSVAYALIDVHNSKSPKKHPYYPLYREVELIAHAPRKLDVDPALQTKLINIHFEQTMIQQEIAALKGRASNELLNRSKELKKQYVQLKSQEALQKKYDATLQELHALSDKCAVLRKQLQDGEQHKDNLYSIRDAHLFNLIFLGELLMFPPWWMIYQPVALEIGDTFLGSLQDIHDAVQACKHHGLQVIADVIVNNLAAVAGERDDWIYNYSGASFKLQNMLRDVFGTDDLTSVTPRIECADGQEPTQCWMSGALPQLNQNHPAVLAQQGVFMQSLLAAGFDGVRIDAAAHLTPQECKRIINVFPGVSYIEYVGGSESWRAYPDYMYNIVRVEDFAIGEDLYAHIFSEHSQFERIKNYGGARLQRHTNLDSVVMIVNHDQVMGSIPSRIFNSLPSHKTYELSLAYLLQRIYGHVLLMPHDIEFLGVHNALKLRKRMKDEGIVREYVQMRDNGHIFIYKYNLQDECKFVCVFNLRESDFITEYGVVSSLAFRWFAVDNDEQSMNLQYNRRYSKWMQNYYRGRNGRRRGFTRRQKHLR